MITMGFLSNIKKEFRNTNANITLYLIIDKKIIYFHKTRGFDIKKAGNHFRKPLIIPGMTDTVLKEEGWKLFLGWELEAIEKLRNGGMDFPQPILKSTFHFLAYLSNSYIDDYINDYSIAFVYNRKTGEFTLSYISPENVKDNISDSIIARLGFHKFE